MLQLRLCSRDVARSQSLTTVLGHVHTLRRQGVAAFTGSEAEWHGGGAETTQATRQGGTGGDAETRSHALPPAPQSMNAALPLTVPEWVKEQRNY